MREQRRAMGALFDGDKHTVRKGASAVHHIAAASAALLATAKVLSREAEAEVAKLMRANRLLCKYASKWLQVTRSTGPGRREALATAHRVRARTHIFMVGLRRANTITGAQLGAAAALISAKTRVAIMRARLRHPFESADVTAARWQLARLARRFRLRMWRRQPETAPPRAWVCEDGRYLAAACQAVVGDAAAPLLTATAWTVTLRQGSVAVPSVDVHRRLLVRGKPQPTKVVLAYRCTTWARADTPWVRGVNEKVHGGRSDEGTQNVRPRRPFLDPFEF